MLRRLVASPLFPLSLWRRGPTRCHLSATLAGAGLDLGAFRRRHEAHPHKGEATQAPSSPSSVRAMTAPLPCVVRGRVERVRGQGKRISFLHVRQPLDESVQVVCFGAALAAQAKAISPESVVEIEGEMRPSEVAPIVSTSCAYHELHATAIRVLSAADTPLPFPLHDENTRLDTRLNHRAIDLRTRPTSAALRIVSAVCQSYRAALLELDFVEVHTPKLIAAASEGGSTVFEVNYFDAGKAYLAQSPQLYKQMCINGDAMRVFEIGPVFRAEKSLTHRHLTEFTGLDAELVIGESYTEVLDVLEHVMCRVLRDLQDEGKPFAALVKAAAAAFKERPDSSADQEGRAARTPMVGAAAGEIGGGAPSSGAHSPPDIVCEVSEETMAKHGIVADVAAEGNDSSDVSSDGDERAGRRRDLYNARVGGATLEVRRLNHSDGVGGETLTRVACPRVLRLRFDDAVRLLQDAKEADAAMEDFSLPHERKLGRLVKARYGVDLYVVDCWPKASRPFYTMPCRDGDCSPSSSSVRAPSSRTRSYDMYLCGEEICSGSQRQHNAEMLTARLSEEGIVLRAGDGLTDYVDAFRYGAWPHGGFGLGLERIVSFFLGARDIRLVSLFPRDPRRLTP